jgi:hypothetical protein
MSEKHVTETTTKTVKTAEKALEGLIKKAWSIMDAMSEKEMPSQYLSDQAIRSIQGRE